MKNKNKNWHYYLPIASIIFIISACGSTADDSKSCVISTSTQQASSSTAKTTPANLKKLQTKQATKVINQFDTLGGVPIETYTKNSAGDYTLATAKTDLEFKHLSAASKNRTAGFLRLASMLFNGVVIAVPDKSVIADPSDFAAVKKLSLSSAKFSFTSEAGSISVKPETLLLPESSDYRLYFYFPDIVTITQAYLNSSSTLRLDEYIQNTSLNLEQAISNGYNYGFYAVTGKNALDCNPSEGNSIRLVQNSKAFKTQSSGTDFSHSIDTFTASKLDFRGNKPEIDTWLVPNTFTGSSSNVTITSPISNIENPELEMFYAYSLDGDGLVSNLFYAELPRQYPEMLKYGSDRKLLPIQNLTWDINAATNEADGRTWSYFSYLRPKVATTTQTAARYCNNYSNLWQVGLNADQVKDKTEFKTNNGRYYYTGAEINDFNEVQTLLDLSDSELRIKLPSASEFLDISALSDINKELYLNPIAESLTTTTTINKLNFGKLSINNSGLIFSNATALTLRDTDPCYSKVEETMLPANFLSSFKFFNILDKKTITNDDTVDQRIDIAELLSLKEMTLIEDPSNPGAVLLTINELLDNIDTDLISVDPRDSNAICIKTSSSTPNSNDGIVTISFTPDIAKDVASPACRILVGDDKGNQKSYSFYFGVPIKVSSREDLASISTLQSKFSGISEFIQTEEIALDISDTSFASSRTIKGTYDGNNQTINIDATTASREGRASIFESTNGYFLIKNLNIEIKQLPVLVPNGDAESFGFLFHSILDSGAIESVNIKVSALDTANPNTTASITRNGTGDLGFYAGFVDIGMGEALNVFNSNLELSTSTGLKSEKSASIGGYFGNVQCYNNPNPSLVMLSLNLKANTAGSQAVQISTTSVGAKVSSGTGGFIGKLDSDCVASLTSLKVEGNLGLFGTGAAGGIVGIIDGGTGRTTISDSRYSNFSPQIATIYAGYSGFLKDSERGKAGSLVGNANNLKISNSHVSAVIITSGATAGAQANMDAGGLVGKGSYLTIENSSATDSSITAGTNSISTFGGTAGGLVGTGSNTSIINSYASNTASSNEISGTFFGGLIGSATSLLVNNSFFMGNLTIADSNGVRLGGICGYCENDTSFNKVLVSASFRVSANGFTPSGDIGGAIGNFSTGTNIFGFSLDEVAVINNYDGLISTGKQLGVKSVIGAETIATSYVGKFNFENLYKVDLSTQQLQSGMAFIDGDFPTGSTKITGTFKTSTLFIGNGAARSWNSAPFINGKEGLYLNTSDPAHVGFESAQILYYKLKGLIN